MGSGFRNRRFIFLFLILGFLTSVNAFGLTKEEADEIRKEATNFKYNTVTTKEGLNFRVPEDMPVETRNGIQSPIPFDEYMYGKFKQIENRLNSIDAKLNNIEAMLTAPKDSKPKELKG